MRLAIGIVFVELQSTLIPDGKSRLWAKVAISADTAKRKSDKNCCILSASTVSHICRRLLSPHLLGYFPHEVYLGPLLVLRQSVANLA